MSQELRMMPSFFEGSEIFVTVGVWLCHPNVYVMVSLLERNGTVLSTHAEI